MQTIKKDLYDHCLKFVESRLNHIKKRIASIQDSLNSETKSSAGDKHETGRAMLHLEREKSGTQLAAVQKLQKTLSKINISSPSTTSRLGSLVETSQGIYFLSISIGEISIDNKSYFAIATNTPIGKLLLGKKVGDSYTFNGKSFKIEKIS